jgi:hypothetical protein
VYGLAERERRTLVRPDGELLRIREVVEIVGRFIASITHIFEIDEVLLRKQWR